MDGWREGVSVLGKGIEDDRGAPRLSVSLISPFALFDFCVVLRFGVLRVGVLLSTNSSLPSVLLCEYCESSEAMPKRRDEIGRSRM